LIEVLSAAPADSSAGAALFLNPSFSPTPSHLILAAQSAVMRRKKLGNLSRSLRPQALPAKIHFHRSENFTSSHRTER